MASVQPGNLIKEVRLRKELQQVSLQESNNHSLQSISGIENNRHVPREGLRDTLLSQLKMPKDDFFCPYLDGASSDIYQMRNQLLLCLDEAEDKNALEEARRIIDYFEKTEVFKKARNRQFLLSCKARYNELAEGDPAATYEDAMEGMAITFPEFDIGTFAGRVLIFEESELLHTYALALKRNRDLGKAVALLTQIKQGIEKFSEDDIEKEKKLAQVLLTLSSCLMLCDDYAGALKICDEGNEASLKYSRGRYTPAFLHHKAVCLLSLGRMDESFETFKPAYFGNMLLHRKAQAERVRTDAKKMTGREINTYGADKLEFEPIDYRREYDLTPHAYGSPGEMICAWRKQAGLTLEELSCGICARSYLYKIETNAVKQPGVYMLEALAERLGRDHNLYFTTFVSHKTFAEKQKRSEILSLLALRKYDRADALLTALEASKDYQSGINRQFILNARISIVMSKGDVCDKDYLNLVTEAIKLTIPDFDERRVRDYYLTHTEVILINKLANHYGKSDNVSRAFKITEQLIENIEKRVVDESEKLRSYGSLLYNYSKTVGGQSKYHDEWFYAEKGINFAVKNGHLINLARLYINKGSAVYHLYEKKEACIPYYAMAYYGAALVNNEGNKKNIADTVEEKLGLRFT